jgi:glycosyltransferase involved in cell wall biosynthesis
MNKPLLSICIPTYNRASYLKKSIESIISQKEFIDEKVEIIISDNASSDDTQSVVACYTSKYKNIHYFKNEKNVRDQNFPIVLSEGNGLLRRLSNDTSIYKPDALYQICKVIENNLQDRPYIFWAEGCGKIKEQLKFFNFRDGITDVSFYITAISCFSVWENECIDIKNDISGCELSLWQVRKSLEIMHKADKVLVFNEKTLNIQPVKNKDISYGLFKVFYNNYFYLLSPYFQNASLVESDREYLEKDLLYNFFTNWCVNWELNNKKFCYSKTENLKDAIESQYKNKPYWEKYCHYYKRKYFKQKIKNIVKKILGK